MKGKKTLLSILLGLCVCLTSAVLLTACEKEETDPNFSYTSMPTEDSSDEESGIMFNTLDVDGNNVSSIFPNSTESFSFADEVTVKGESTFIVAMDEFGVQTIVTKKIPLQEGDNVAYVIEMIGDEVVKIYNVTIRRRPMYTVTFNANGGRSVESQKVEEGNFVIQPTTTRAGYIFVQWDYNFDVPIMQSTEIKATWKARNDTKYKVNYYLQNIEDNNYSLEKTIELTGTTDMTVSADIKEYKHFSYNADKSTIQGKIHGNGNLVLNVYYVRDKYSISTNNSWGEITVKGDYKYGKEITTTATWNLGYDFLGWYSGEELLSTDETYTFSVEKEVTANFVISVGMSDFYFTSTATTCTISHPKDETITEIVIPDCITRLGNYAFYECSNLKSVIFGENSQLTSIGDYAFQYCNSLKEIVIPDGVTSIGKYAFFECSSLTTITFEGTVEEWDAISKGTDWNNGVPATEVVCSDGTVAL
ncbi:MAG: leucine-rich repeat protein [Clostridia bacterium]|nr:leucine-rich repeat protein [Clostridia bacterium]